MKTSGATKTKLRGRGMRRSKSPLVFPSINLSLLAQHQAPKPVQPQLQSTGRELLEEVWDRVSPGSHLLFKLFEPATTSRSVSPEGRDIAKAVCIGSFLYGLDRLVKQLNA